METRSPADTKHWYKDAIVYQLHARVFYDSNRDETGNFRGLTEKLDYLRDLGITAIGLLPFYLSPLKGDGDHFGDGDQCHTAFHLFTSLSQLLGRRIVASRFVRPGSASAASDAVFVAPQGLDTLQLLNTFRLERTLQQIGYGLSHAP